MPDRSKRRKSFTSEKAAKQYQAELISHRARSGSYIDPRRGSKVLVSAVYQRWLTSRADFSPKVRYNYESYWRLRVGPAFGSWPVNRVDSESVQRWVNSMSVGPRTQRGTHTLLRMVLDLAVSEKLIAANPAADTHFPPLPIRQHLYLTAGEVHELAELCGPQGDVVTILAYTGLRFGELVGLHCDDVDLAKRRIRVRRSVTQVRGRLVAGGPKTRAGRRTVPIPQTLLPVLNRRIDGRPALEPAITSPRGGMLSRENWVRSVDWYKQRAELGRPTLRIHDLRHTYASLARSAGADLRLLQAALGHRSITTTAGIYADLFDHELDAVADAMDSLHIDPPSDS
ncbi:tyrosine-type recombinase/integrase [Jongsikchunia kroppenstedtii]|uniref:tyrosine-type recombinase/integrase n=1 Tax=Jongsikchunia kroppenstedtii TaxID=1121721 RepID=UPI001FDED560|nr:site-specific integrase [Jongsikchunia kroppenstedtii]